jgi:DNA-binding CsgD family transcriptional regulator
VFHAHELEEILRLVEECRELVRRGRSPSGHLARGVARIARASLRDAGEAGNPESGSAPREEELLSILRSSAPWLFAEGATPGGAGARLSPRERETLRLLRTGTPEKAVAERLGISRHTAHQYVKSVYKKLGVTSRAELISRANDICAA